MKIAVVDDERPARSELKYLISQCEPNTEIAEADDSETFLEMLDSESFDVCFVDINLGGMNGTTLASMIKRKQPDTLIIFATAFQEYAVKAFEIGAIDYLLKPFDYERVKRALARVHENLKEKEAEPGYEIGKIMVNVGASFQILDVADIVFIETEKRSCKIHMKDGSFFLQNESLNNYETHLKKSRFFRIHKSYLINLDYVKEMQVSYNNGYCVKMKYYDAEALPIGRTQVKEFRQIFEK